MLILCSSSNRNRSRMAIPIVHASPSVIRHHNNIRTADHRAATANPFAVHRECVVRAQAIRQPNPGCKLGNVLPNFISTPTCRPRTIRSATFKPDETQAGTNTMPILVRVRFKVLRWPRDVANSKIRCCVKRLASPQTGRQEDFFSSCLGPCC